MSKKILLLKDHQLEWPEDLLPHPIKRQHLLQLKTLALVITRNSQTPIPIIHNQKNEGR